MGLGGCVTSGGLEGPEADEARRVVASSCVINSTRDGAINSTENLRNDISIYRVDNGQDGWVRTEMAASGVYGVIYYNKLRRDVACGTDSWREQNIEFVKQAPAT
jgi:hypothetical protein